MGGALSFPSPKEEEKKTTTTTDRKPDCSDFVLYNHLENPGKKNVRLVSYPGLSAGEKKIYSWIDYNKFKDTITQVPKQAKKATLTKQIVNKYYCGNKVPLAQDKKKLSKYKKDKYSYIHENGGRPFIVYVNKNYVDVFRIPKNMFIDPDKEIHLNRNHYSEKVASLKPLDVFIGKSPKNAMTTFSMGYGKKFDGNTILVRTGKKKYVFIGGSVFHLVSLSDIVQYSSPVGNNDVPYPYAVDKDGNNYLFLEKVILLNKKLVDLSREEDPYNYYYRNKDAKKQTKHLRLKMIARQD